MGIKKGLKLPPVPAKPLTTAIIGLGSRGRCYASFAKRYPEWYKVVALCDLDGIRCQKFAEEYNVPPENVFEGDWSLMASRPKLADAVVICTQDRAHAGPAVALANLGYHILMEKPMAVTMEDCVKIYNAVMKNKVMFAIGHVYRYIRYQQTIKRILDSKILGEIMNIQLLEPIGFWHFAHSYVRGNWHNESQSAFTLLTKSCHDLDILADMMGTKCKRISSFGSLTYFKKEKKPKKAGEALNCLDCAYEKECPYSAKKIYLERFENLFDRDWPINVVQPHGEIDSENLTAALRKGNYGRCVYEMDNDVCDQQVVNMEFENGSTASFSMIAFTETDFKRKIRIFGTKGELVGDGANEIIVYDFLSRKKEIFRPSEEPRNKISFLQLYQGASYELIQSFILACLTRNQDFVLSGPKETLESHLYVFAAEHARRSGTVVNIDEFRKQFDIEEPNELPEEQQLCCPFKC